MKSKDRKYPNCFGELETVFPKGKYGLRTTPDGCFRCDHKTECLRTAMAGRDGLTVRQECIDKAYAAGRISFIERWSHKKAIDQQIREKSRYGKGPRR
jgi:hypothetical protein